MAELRWGAATDPGRIRPDNEDNLLAEANVFAVADGMGGHRAGEVASLLAVDLLRSRLSEPGADLEAVVAAIAEVNGDIYRAAIGNPDHQGMGTTVTALAVIATAEPAETEPSGGTADTEPIADTTSDAASAPAEQLALVNVGDSRTYLMRHDRLRRVTVDHSYVQELVATGHITDDEARTHPRRNIVTRALGIDPAVRVDAWTLPLVRGDRFLLCSDGLVDEVRDEDIVGILTTVTDPQAAADELVALANRQGGRDNISVIVVDVLAGAEPPDPDAELDFDPVWEESDDDATVVADEHESEAATFDDLAAIVGGEDPRAVEAATAIATATTSTAPTGPTTISTAPDTAQPTGTAPKRRRRVIGFIAGLGVLAVLVLALVIAAAWARRSYFVAFDDTDTVVIYRGQKDGFLWFDPTVQNPTVLTKDELDEQSIARVEEEPVFASREAAENFVNDQLETTTTTSTTTSTTSTTTTTLAPTTTTIAG